MLTFQRMETQFSLGSADNKGILSLLSAIEQVKHRMEIMETQQTLHSSFEMLQSPVTKPPPLLDW